MNYDRIKAFENIGPRHAKLKNKTCAIVGAGAVGSNTALLLAKSGIGRLIIADRDIVEEENLPFSPYQENDIGKPKTLALRQKISYARVIELAVDIDHNNVGLLKSDLIIDCTDNLQTRFLLNEYCLKNKIPLIHAAALGNLVSIFVVWKGACLSCIYSGKATTQTCETAGLLPASAMIASSLQANEALKVLLGAPEKDLLRIDIWSNSFSKIKVKINPNCLVHKGLYDKLAGKGGKIVQMCGSHLFQIKGPAVDLKQIKKATKGKDFGYCIVSEKITVFEDGRALIKAKNQAEARSIYSRIVGN